MWKPTKLDISVNKSETGLLGQNSNIEQGFLVKKAPNSGIYFVLKEIRSDQKNTGINKKVSNSKLNTVLGVYMV